MHVGLHQFKQVLELGHVFMKYWNCIHCNAADRDSDHMHKKRNVYLHRIDYFSDIVDA